MKYSPVRIGAFFGAALVAACGGSAGLPRLTTTAPLGDASFTRPSSVESILHEFKGSQYNDGAQPLAAPTYVNRALYGTTAFGGSTKCRSFVPIPGCGTIFKIDSSGTGYRVLYAFPSTGSDGAVPGSRLVYLGGVLYGSTIQGGTGCGGLGCGVVFSINPSGKAFHIVHKFQGSDGSDIQQITAIGATIYGVANNGGSSACENYARQYQCGVVFSLTPAGSESTVHVFAKPTDGRNPQTAPIELNGMLYGTTVAGGGTPCTYTPYTGCGTIYKVSTSGKGYAIIHRFNGGEDGQSPNNLIAVNGNLYGTTYKGGGSGCQYGIGCGTVFKIDITGQHYSVLYRFTGGADGGEPVGIEAQAGGTLYAASQRGGETKCSLGCGTVFKIDTSGNAHAVLFRFTGSSSMYPSVGPIKANGAFYGVSQGGYSACQFGCGTIYAVKL